MLAIEWLLLYVKAGHMWEKKINTGLRPCQVRAHHCMVSQKESEGLKLLKGG